MSFFFEDDTFVVEKSVILMYSLIWLLVLLENKVFVERSLRKNIKLL